jgi:uncharacterized protein (DUF2147 family)
MNRILQLILCVIVFSGFTAKGQNKKNPADNIIGRWLTQQKTGVIEIYKHGAKFYGKLAWIKDSVDKKTNLPPKDTKNPDPALRGRNIKGLELLSSFQYVGENNYKEGKVYDPERGDVYNCKMHLSDDGKTLDFRGYIGISLLGRTEKWTRITEFPK